ncbi:MAG: hypothetical protein WCS72_13935, partial [Deltaproteobacteria bacterium]
AVGAPVPVGSRDADEPQAQDQERSRNEVPAGSPEAARPGAVEIDGAGQRGIPFLPSVPAPAAAAQGTTLDLAVMSLVRTQTIGGTDGGNVWGTDVEITPGVGLQTRLPTLGLAAAYGARFSIPINAAGAEVAVLQRGYLRADWKIDPLWLLSVDASGTYGQYSQLVPVATPGGAGGPPPALNPIRSFTTYPYLSLAGALRLEAQLATRSRLRVSAGYVDVGGIGDEGAAAQPRTWGPLASAAFEWDASPFATLTTSAAYQDSILVGNLAVQIGTLTETWRQQWTPDVETTVSAGAAITSTDSATFLTFSHLLPVASAGIGYHTDVRHTLKLGLDVALAPFVDTYLRTAYQRVTGRLGVDWRPDPALLLGLYVAAALVPYTAGTPDAYGTAGASIAWAPGKIVTFNLGGFSQSQIQGAAATAGAFRQWTAYFSVTLRDILSL